MPRSATAGRERIDGEWEAIAFLERMRLLNWDAVPKPQRGNTDALMAVLTTIKEWPQAEQEKFAEVIADVLSESVIGFGIYVESYRTDFHARRAKSDAGYRSFLAGLAGSGGAP